MSRTSSGIGVKLIAIGNSKGIRIPKVLREKYGWRESIIAEETEDWASVSGDLVLEGDVYLEAGQAARARRSCFAHSCWE